MTDYRAVFPILAMQNIVQKCSHFAYDYCRRFFLCFQAQALTVRNLQHLRNRPFAQVLWGKYCVLMIPHRSSQPYVPTQKQIDAPRQSKLLIVAENIAIFSVSRPKILILIVALLSSRLTRYNRWPEEVPHNRCQGRSSPLVHMKVAQ